MSGADPKQGLSRRTRKARSLISEAGLRRGLSGRTKAGVGPLLCWFVLSLPSCDEAMQPFSGNFDEFATADDDAFLVFFIFFIGAFNMSRPSSKVALVEESKPRSARILKCFLGISSTLPPSSLLRVRFIDSLMLAIAKDFTKVNLIVLLGQVRLSSSVLFLFRKNTPSKHTAVIMCAAADKIGISDLNFKQFPRHRLPGRYRFDCVKLPTTSHLLV
uniref:Uncharacterized protein n=1 Tax=Glossina austeni TaxID=7395 RepID=A0A1A9UEJ4_GLOAU